MRFFRSFKFAFLQNQRWVKFRHDRKIGYYYRKWPPFALAYLVGLTVFGVVYFGPAHFGGNHEPGSGTTGLNLQKTLRFTHKPYTHRTPILDLTQGGSGTAWHASIITTIFWVGEPADADNGYIPNMASAWDGQWEKHYGGVDNPDKRAGYRPAAFVPKENPFYFALPYDDISDSGKRKSSATDCPNYPSMKSQAYSWCKNGWIAVRFGGKTAYAQWEDVGPFEENDTSYVFGYAKPTNTDGVNAGLDVSPAVRDYLGLEDVNKCDWTFVPAGGVPSGPWSKTVTTSLGYSI